MKRKLSILSILFSVISVFAQSGLMGGTDGIHQMNAYTLGQWQFVAGTGGNVSVDPWALSRNGVYYTNGEERKLQDFKLSATGNFFIGVGIMENVDIGVGIPINYDRSYADGYLEATGNIRAGDLDLWIKVKAPFLGDSDVVNLAAQFDLYMPTGAKRIGLRPRHAWHLRNEGYTQPYTANEVVPQATGIVTVDLTKINVPLRWNTNIGFVYANEGTNTLTYGTGLDAPLTEWFIPFFEFSGEFRVEKTKYPRDLIEDPMTFTPGLRLKLPYNVDLAGGFDISMRSLRNLSRSKSKELKNSSSYELMYMDDKDSLRTYGYVPAPTIAFTGLLTWHFGVPPKAPEPCPVTIPKIDTVIVHKTDTVKVEVIKVDTIVQVQVVLDHDGDGVVDSLDKCPNTPQGQSVGSDGCPLDFDKDGVPDELDKCPNTKEGVTVDSIGCPLDADKDGVPDVTDKCPNTPQGIMVDSTGCPPDSDKDGVPDYLDKCPNTLPGIKVNKHGCPINKKEDLDNLKKGINFETGSAKLTKASHKTLNDIVALLKKITAAKLEIQGHTDNVGSPEKNKVLSQDRAQAVVDYMVDNGIASDRLRAAGYGQDKPIADNKTKKGRAQNRRVELVPFYDNNGEEDE